MGEFGIIHLRLTGNKDKSPPIKLSEKWVRIFEGEYWWNRDIWMDNERTKFFYTCISGKGFLHRLSFPPQIEVLRSRLSAPPCYPDPRHRWPADDGRDPRVPKVNHVLGPPRKANLLPGIHHRRASRGKHEVRRFLVTLEYPPSQMIYFSFCITLMSLMTVNVFSSFFVGGSTAWQNASRRAATSTFFRQNSRVKCVNHSKKKEEKKKKLFPSMRGLLQYSFKCQSAHNTCWTTMKIQYHHFNSVYWYQSVTDITQETSWGTAKWTQLKLLK